MLPEHPGRRVEPVRPQGEDRDSPRRPCQESPAPENELRRPYWRYLERQNLEDRFERRSRGAEAPGGPVYEPIRPAKLGAAKVGEVSAVRPHAAARVQEVYRVARFVGVGRVIDVVA
ncbi:hypothetical protein PHYC_02486 [Phycisphaerales bacterium]|nr:hypothetical protein PHYC_02486 [Phycisphaerales bacterium]